MKSISRRQFFKGSTGIAGAAALMPFAQAQQIPPHCQNVPTKWDFTADVVVVGAGACGMASAIRAADAGADICTCKGNNHLRNRHQGRCEDDRDNTSGVDL